MELTGCEKCDDLMGGMCADCALEQCHDKYRSVVRDLVTALTALDGTLSFVNPSVRAVYHRWRHIRLPDTIGDPSPLCAACGATCAFCGPLTTNAAAPDG
jgi:hypothetical protein